MRASFSVIVVLLLLGMSGCFTISYSFSGASIHPDIKTASVQHFQNRAQQVQPGVGQLIADLLRDKVESQTSLSITSGYGDVDFEGVITGFSTSPTSITSQEQAAQNRFTISVSVNFANTVEPDLSFESSFSRFIDYPSTMSFEEAQSTYTEEILELLVDDIFNKAFVNW